MKFGMEEYTMGPYLRAKFGPERGGSGYSSPLKLVKITGFGSFPELHTSTPLLFPPFPSPTLA